MQESTRSFLRIALWFALVGVIPVAFHLAYNGGGFVKDAVDTAFRPPHSPTKYLMWGIFALVFLAVPFGLREMVTDRRYVRQERAMRAARPDDAVTEYVGPEGRGYLFDGPGGRTLLLEPEAGLGAPRVVELPPVPAEPEAQPEPAPEPSPEPSPAPDEGRAAA